MGYLQESIQHLRALRLSLGEEAAAASIDHPMVAMLAAMPEAFSDQRKMMIEQLRASLVFSGADLDIARLERALDAMARVEREQFVASHIAELAYLPTPLGIGHGQTISHPQIVAVMTYAVAYPDLGPVLDVGTGSGYQAAVLSCLADRVTSIEVVAELAQVARARLSRQGFHNIDCVVGDVVAQGGLPDGSFDAILVAAGAADIPTSLLERLNVGGRLVMPIGPRRSSEQLILAERRSLHEFRYSNLGPVAFVPLTGDGARGDPGHRESDLPHYHYGCPITPTRP